jgi:hypothetical protein
MTPTSSSRTLTTRLPSELLERLELERFTRSKLAGRRVSVRSVVESALKEMLSRSTESCLTGDRESQP